MTNNDGTTSRSAESPQSGTEGSVLSRRVMLRGATLGGLSLPLLAACGGGDDSSGATSEATSGGASASGTAGDPLTVATSDVPVGGGAIFPDDKVVVTQPTKGEYKAFSAVCTHQGCLVSEVTDSQIVCKCHGSHFAITDGAPVEGPAKAPLGGKKVAVKGTEITVT